MTDEAPERFARDDASRRPSAAVVAELREQGLIARTEAYIAHGARSRIARASGSSRSISLQWFMRMDELAPAGDRGRSAAGRSASRPSAGRASTSTGWRTSGRGASRASCGGATRSRSGTAARRPTSGTSAPEGEGWERDPDVLDTWFLERAVAVRDARLAGATRRSCGPSTRPTRSSPAATSSSSGWRG